MNRLESSKKYIVIFKHLDVGLLFCIILIIVTVK